MTYLLVCGGVLLLTERKKGLVCFVLFCATSLCTFCSKRKERKKEKEKYNLERREKKAKKEKKGKGRSRQVVAVGRQVDRHWPVACLLCLTFSI